MDKTFPAHDATVCDRFWAKVDKGDPSGCWLWTASLNRYGYGQFGVRVGGKVLCFAPHRVSYELLVGPIPSDLQIHHWCEVRRCCNPEHLEPMTLQENGSLSGSPSAHAARTDRCKRGHPLYGPNLYVHRGHRYCRTCRLAWKRRARTDRQHPTGAAP
jgi:hypothetical protein